MTVSPGLGGSSEIHVFALAEARSTGCCAASASRCLTLPRALASHPPRVQGTLRRNDATYSLKWDAPVDLVTGHNEAGRGCELSELVRFNDDLYTFDDRTGIMFQIANPDRSDASPAPLLLPRHIFSEGGGSINDKGLKIEWATVKDGLLYTGSFGKEFTNMEGKVVHTNNLWAVSYGKDGTVTHLDWKPYYDKLRSAMGYEYPGYLLHECITWSPHHRKWFILPRRMSKVAYEEALDEKMGANTMIIASHDFEDITWFSVGVSVCFFLACEPVEPHRVPTTSHHRPPARLQTKTDVRGFSSAKFLPGSRDSVLVALKSEENSASGTQKTYITIYGEVPAGSGKWDVLMEETELPIAAKFEGLEVLSAS